MFSQECQIYQQAEDSLIFSRWKCWIQDLNASYSLSMSLNNTHNEIADGKLICHHALLLSPYFYGYILKNILNYNRISSEFTASTLPPCGPSVIHFNNTNLQSTASHFLVSKLVELYYLFMKCMIKHIFAVDLYITTYYIAKYQYICIFLHRLSYTYTGLHGVWCLSKVVNPMKIQISHTFIHPFRHYSLFRDANQSTTHIYEQIFLCLED